MKISIIMRTKNSDWVLKQALSALFSQRELTFELLVVDSGSTDTTLEIVQAYDCQLIQIKPEDYVPGKVLNMAIENTQHDIIVFLNSDSVLLSPLSIHTLVMTMIATDSVAAYGRQIPRPEADLWVQRDYANSFPDSKHQPSWMGISLPLAAIKRSAWRKHRFYSDAWGSEDTEWGVWAKASGHKICYVKDAITMHSHNYTCSQLYGRRFIEGEADAFIYSKDIRLAMMLVACLRQISKDVILYLKNRKFSKILHQIMRSITYQWGYYRGIKLGNKRKQNKALYVHKAQDTVMKYYG
jgi:rhamnosyltransferase